MEEKNQDIQMLELMQRPAFYAENGIITYVNSIAANYLLQPGMTLATLLASGEEEYATFTQACLHATVQLQGLTLDATIIRQGSKDLVLLEENTGASPLRALALAALELRIPMSNAAAITDRILPLAAGEEQKQMQEYAAQLNRRMMQMQRIISNMSDCETFGIADEKAMEYVEICSLLQEQLSGAAEALAQAGITLEYSLPEERIFTLAYPQKLERSVYNMLSNAAKFSPKGSTIRAQLTCRGNRLALSITDHGSGIRDAGDVFSQYLRQPGLEDPRIGLGLGMVLIRATATLHGGAVLLDHPEGTGTRITMTMAIQKDKTTEVRSPILRIDYAGERDHCLLELSDVLPAELYSMENMK